MDKANLEKMIKDIEQDFQRLKDDFYATIFSFVNKTGQEQQRLVNKYNEMKALLDEDDKLPKKNKGS